METESPDALSFKFQFEEDQNQASAFEKMTSKPPMIYLRKMIPSHKDKPWFLLMPDCKDPDGQRLVLRGHPMIGGLPEMWETFGKAQISIETVQPWGKLFPAKIEARGVFTQFSGDLSLGHKRIWKN